jgi:4-aminobutyrate aminotransferase-like enzyme
LRFLSENYLPTMRRVASTVFRHTLFLLGPLTTAVTLTQTESFATFCDSPDDGEIHAPHDHQTKGSFLLKTSKELSDAAKAASRFGTDDKPGSLNEKIGRLLISLRDKTMGPNVSVFYKQDGGLVVTSGKGAFLRDVDGHEHLDCCNNVAAVGHAHPTVVKAGQDELARIQTNGRFLNPVQQVYVTKLLSTFPPELNTIYFVNSGSEANDLALRIAREHTKAKRPKDIIVLDSAYHGHTQALVDISPYKWYQAIDEKEYQPKTTHVVACPDGYRGKYRLGQTEECAKLYAQDVEKIVNSREGGVGIFIAESIVGCGGQIVPPPTYLKRVYAAVRKQGGVCIADEVQTGFARTGTHFWMFQRHGVVPDIVTVGKPMGEKDKLCLRFFSCLILIISF